MQLFYTTKKKGNLHIDIKHSFQSTQNRNLVTSWYLTLNPRVGMPITLPWMRLLSFLPCYSTCSLGKWSQSSKNMWGQRSSLSFHPSALTWLVRNIGNSYTETQTCIVVCSYLCLSCYWSAFLNYTLILLTYIVHFHSFFQYIINLVILYMYFDSPLN